jgi:hypothetical protein
MIIALALALQTQAALLPEDRAIWPAAGLYYVETGLVLSPPAGPEDMTVAHTGDTLASRSATPLAVAVAQADAVDRDGIIRAVAGLPLFEAVSRIPGRTFCGRVFPNFPRDVSPFSCLVDSDADGEFDHVMMRASPSYPTNPVVSAAADPVTLADPVRYTVEARPDTPVFEFAVINAEENVFGTEERPPVLRQRFSMTDGVELTSSMGIELDPYYSGSTANFWGFCFEIGSVEGLGVKYRLVGSDDGVLSWSDRSIISPSNAEHCAPSH